MKGKIYKILGKTLGALIIISLLGFGLEGILKLLDEHKTHNPFNFSIRNALIYSAIAGAGIVLYFRFERDEDWIQWPDVIILIVAGLIAAVTSIFIPPQLQMCLCAATVLYVAGLFGMDEVW